MICKIKFLVRPHERFREMLFIIDFVFLWLLFNHPYNLFIFNQANRFFDRIFSKVLCHRESCNSRRKLSNEPAQDFEVVDLDKPSMRSRFIYTNFFKEFLFQNHQNFLNKQNLIADNCLKNKETSIVSQPSASVSYLASHSITVAIADKLRAKLIVKLIKICCRNTKIE